VGITFVFVTHDQEEALTMSDRIAVMSQGVALQIGTPTEIYERPNCRFVADFIGETNFLDGTVRGQEGRTLAVVLANGQTIHAEADAPLPDGTAVSVAVRPEKLHLRATDGLPNCFPGRVVDVVYIGTDTHYGVALDGGQHVRVREQNNVPGDTRHAGEGDAVTVGFAAQAARVLTD
jgi:spermidine/putrescine transport system ATP-binding protein